MPRCDSDVKDVHSRITRANCSFEARCSFHRNYKYIFSFLFFIFILLTLFFVLSHTLVHAHFNHFFFKIYIYIFLFLTSIERYENIPDQLFSTMKEYLNDHFPKAHKEFLRLLFSLLVKISAQSSVNMMNTENIIRCLAPTIGCTPRILHYFLVNYNDIFWESKSIYVVYIFYSEMQVIIENSFMVIIYSLI